MQQIVIEQLGGGVAFDGERQFLGGHAAAVVLDGDEGTAAVADHDIDPRRSGVDGVLHQLLDDRRRPFDDLAGGNTVDDGLWQQADGHP